MCCLVLEATLAGPGAVATSSVPAPGERVTQDVDDRLEAARRAVDEAAEAAEYRRFQGRVSAWSQRPVRVGPTNSEASEAELHALAVATAAVQDIRDSQTEPAATLRVELLLLQGRGTEAVRAFLEIQDPSQEAQVAGSAALLERGRERDDPRDFLAALETSTEAAAKSGDPSAARFNRTVALQLLGFADLARAEWGRLADPSTSWGKEAQGYFLALAKKPDNSALERARTQAEDELCTLHLDGAKLTQQSEMYTTLGDPIYRDIARGIANLDGSARARAKRLAEAICQLRTGVPANGSCEGVLARSDDVRLAPLELLHELSCARAFTIRGHLASAVELLRRAQKDKAIAEYPSVAGRMLYLGGFVLGLKSQRSESSALVQRSLRFSLRANDYATVGRSEQELAHYEWSVGNTKEAWRLAVRALQHSSSTSAGVGQLLEIFEASVEEGFLAAAGAALDAAELERPSLDTLVTLAAARARLTGADPRSSASTVQVQVGKADALLSRLPSWKREASGVLLDRESALALERHSPEEALTRADLFLSHSARFGWDVLRGEVRGLKARLLLRLGRPREAATELDADIKDVVSRCEAEIKPAQRSDLLRLLATLRLDRARMEWEGARFDMALRTAIELWSQETESECRSSISPADVSRTPRNEARLVLLPSPDGLLIWTITSTGIAHRAAAIPPHSLARIVRSARESIALFHSGESGQYLSRLASLLLPADSPALMGIRRLVVIPIGLARAVPFSALRNPRTSRFLIQELSIMVATPTREHKSAARSSPFIVEPENLSQVQLPAAASEAGAVKEILRDAVSILGARATPAAFKRALQEGSVVHFAGHVLGAGDGGPAALVLTPGEDDLGLLSVDELDSLRLVRAPHLVVLAACGDANGENDDGAGSLSIAYALRHAGVRQLVVSLWPVDDLEMARFFRHFYQLDHLDDPEASLRSTQLGSIARDEPLAGWAGLVLVGPLPRRTVGAGKKRTPSVFPKRQTDSGGT